MIQYFRNSIIILSAIASTFVVSCVDADSKFGSTLLPPEWEMKTDIDSTIFPWTSIFSTDSVANIPHSYRSDLASGYLYVGSLIDPLVGRTSAQVFTNYCPYYGFSNDRKFFGDSPVIDSMFIYLYLISPVGDTTTGTTIELFEVMNKDVSRSKFYYTDLDMKPHLNDTALLKFKMNSGAAKRLKLPIEFARKFLINENVPTNPYLNDTLFHKKFNGFYLRSADVTTGKGCVYALDLNSSSMALYYRNKNADTMTKQTLSFRLQHILSGSEYYSSTPYNTSISMAQHDYSYADGSEKAVKKNEIGDSKIQTKYGYVQGLGGLGTAVSIPKEQLDALKAKALAKGYKHIAIHAAELVFAIDDPSWENYDNAFNAIAPYEKTSNMTFITDYNPLYPYAPTAYDGTLNRTQGKYTINISSYIQKLILGKVTNYTIQIGAPIPQHLFIDRTVLMGSASNKPPRLILTYTMTK